MTPGPEGDPRVEEPAPVSLPLDGAATSTDADQSWTLDYELTREAVIESTAAATMEMFAGQRRTVSGGLALLGMTVGSLIAGSGIPALGAVVGVGCLLVAGFTWFSYPQSVRSAVAQSLRVNGEQGIVGRHELHIDARGIRERTEVNERLDGWRAVGRITSHERYLFIHLPGGLFYAVPRTAFEDGAAIDAFLAATQRWRGGG